MIGFIYGKYKRFKARTTGAFWRKLYNEIKGNAYKDRIGRKLIQTFTNKHKVPTSMIFVLGNYNSGTTLLREILGEHPMINTLPFEGVRLTDYFTYPEQLGWERNWVYCKEHLAKVTNLNKEGIEKIHKDWSPFFDDQKILLEKSISHLARIPWLLENYPNARFIGIIRNGYAVADGMSRKSKPVGKAVEEYGRNEYRMEDLGKQWQIANRELLSQLHDRPQAKIVRYESLTEDFDQVIPSIFDFLNLNDCYTYDLKNAQIVSSKNRKFQLSNRNEQSFNRLSESNYAELNEVIGPLMTELKYEIIES